MARSFTATAPGGRGGTWALLCCVALRAGGLTACTFLLPSMPVLAADKVRITGLSDVSFGAITNFAADSLRSQSLCVYAKSAVDNYRVTASGTGSGGAFALSSGSDELLYEVQWSDTSGQTGGVQLSANVPLTGQHSTATRDDCSKGPATTASLIVIVRSAAVTSALAGSYTGSLTIVIAPE